MAAPERRGQGVDGGGCGGASDGAVGTGGIMAKIGSADEGESLLAASSRARAANRSALITRSEGSLAGPLAGTSDLRAQGVQSLRVLQRVFGEDLVDEGRDRIGEGPAPQQHFVEDDAERERDRRGRRQFRP